MKLTKEELRVIYVALENLSDDITNEYDDDRYLGTGETFGEVKDMLGKLLTKTDEELYIKS